MATRAFGSTGSLIRRVHDIELPGFGSLYEEDGRFAGEDLAWSATVRRRCVGLGQVVGAGLVPVELAERAVVALSRHEPLVGRLSTGCLLHGDFHPRHVYAAHSEIVGIIDWGDATIGDPLSELGRLLYAGLLTGNAAKGHRLVRAFLPSYGCEPERFRQHPELLAVYAVVFSLWPMSGELKGSAPSPPWWPRACTTLSKAVDEPNAIHRAATPTRRSHD